MTQQVQLTGGSAAQGTFVRSGEYWTIGFGPTTFSLKDVLGLRYIQRLLQHPGEEFHALDLLSEGGSGVAENAGADRASILNDATLSVGGPGDAGEMLDAKAKQNYKRRLDELREQREELQERGDREGAAAVDSEIDSLAHELARAVGFRGRDRRYGSAAERARLNVTRAIKAAVQKISDSNLPLGGLLNNSLRTGSFCCYAADPRVPVTWQFSLEGSKPSVETKAAPPLLSRRETGFRRALAHRTTFVGREAEHAMMRRFLEQALQGEGKVIMISGAPGVGKTRLADEVGAEAAQMGFLALAGSCYDRDDSAPFIPFVEILEAALAHAPSPEAFREGLGNHAPEIAWLMPQLRRLYPDIPPPLEIPPEQSRRLLFNAVVEVLNRTAANRAVLLLLEDLHWADEGTLLLLNHLARLVSKIPVIIVGTYRDHGLDLGGPLAATLDELIRGHLVERITLSGLPPNAVAEMLRALSGRRPPKGLVSLIYAETEGNPFFVEELYRHLTEQGNLTDSAGEFRGDLKPSDVDVPQSLRLVIGRRLARLSNAAQKALGTAAVIGRSFTFEILEASTQVDADSLLDYIEEAEKAGLIYSKVQYPQARFDFSHELIRQTVFSGLSAPRRQRIHLDVADAIERVYANALEEQAGDLAHHLWQAGEAAEPGRTVRYLEMAAKGASEQGALTEAEGKYSQALDALGRMPATPERDQHELVLRLSLGRVSAATRGYLAAASVAAYGRVSALGERLGDPARQALALPALAALPLLRGEIPAAEALADQVLVAAGKPGASPATLVWGHQLQGVARYHRGDLALAWDSLGRAISAYREEDHKSNPQDPGIETLDYMALTAWQLGMVDGARARMRDAIALAERLRKPYELAHSLFFAAYLHALLRDPAATQRFSEEVIELTKEQSIPLFFDAGRILYGWALAQVGRCEEGVGFARDGLTDFMAVGNRIAIGSFLAFLAEAQVRAGALDDALSIITQGLDAAPDQLVDHPYLLWLRGELLLQKASGQASAMKTAASQLAGRSAEQSFRDTLSLADRIGARSFALRAATSLGRMLKSRARPAEARDLILPLLETFVEGFDTRDLIEAKALRDELN